jgi:D-lactate dehydrogenase (cytochrome)
MELMDEVQMRVVNLSGSTAPRTWKDNKQQTLLWSARKESLWSMLALRKEGNEVWSTDVAVPFSRLADIIEVSKKEMDDLGLFASILGHIGDGNFHESIMYDSKKAGEKEKVEKCVKNMVDRALAMEGTCTVGFVLHLMCVRNELLTPGN